MADADDQAPAAEAVPFVPEFPGQRPPFEPGNAWRVGEGNELAVRHGAYSPRRVDPLAQQLVELALADEAVAFLRAPRYAAGLWAWARAETRVQLLDEWVSGMTIQKAAESSEGRTSPLELLRRWEATAQTHRARLGLDPVSAARLSKDLAQTRQAMDTAAIMAELHRREQQGNGGGGQ